MYMYYVHVHVYVHVQYMHVIGKIIHCKEKQYSTRTYMESSK